jgi:hypothetical protein
VPRKIWPIVEPGKPPSHSRPHRQPLVGHVAKREDLRAQFQSAIYGQVTLVPISGAAGKGKTTLVDDRAIDAANTEMLVLPGLFQDLTTT